MPSLAAPLSLRAPRPAGGNAPGPGRAGPPPCGPRQEEKPVQPFRELAAISSPAAVTSPGRGIPCRRQLRTEPASPASPSLCCPSLSAPASPPQLPYTTPRFPHPSRLHSLLSPSCACSNSPSQLCGFNTGPGPAGFSNNDAPLGPSSALTTGNAKVPLTSRGQALNGLGR